MYKHTLMLLANSSNRNKKKIVQVLGTLELNVSTIFLNFFLLYFTLSYCTILKSV